MVSTTRINWIVNIAIPDSIIINMMDQSLASAGPPLPKVRCPKVGLTSLYTLRILSTISPVTVAFTVKEIPRPVIVNIYPETVI